MTINGQQAAAALRKLTAARIDGITEMQNASGAMFGVERLGEAVAANRAADPETLVARVLATLDGFAEGTLPEDDLTIVVMKLTA